MPSREIEINKTKGTKYVETDEHPFQTNEISHSGVSFNEHDGSVLILKYWQLSVLLKLWKPSYSQSVYS